MRESPPWAVQILGLHGGARPPTQKDEEAGEDKEKPTAGTVPSGPLAALCGWRLSSVLVITTVASFFGLLAMGLSDGKTKVPSAP